MAQEFVAANGRPRRAQPITARDQEPVSAQRGRAESDHVRGQTKALREFTSAPGPVLREDERENRGLNSPPLLV
ncbi:MAG TPA: hypothetical protein VK691_00990 [Solirubrobacteraceae bacterium]|nr:hypothetical protein [Solirubrobacteraceae bacterium]